MGQEYQNLVNWLTQPFSVNQPMWKLILVFIMFIIIGFIVIDNLDLIRRDLRA